MTIQTTLAALAAFYARHEGVLNLLGAAVVINMPKIKRTNAFGVLYGWLYDSMQSFLGAIRPHADKPVEQNPTEAANGQ